MSSKKKTFVRTEIAARDDCPLWRVHWKRDEYEFKSTYPRHHEFNRETGNCVLASPTKKSALAEFTEAFSMRIYQDRPITVTSVTPA